MTLTIKRLATAIALISAQAYAEDDKRHFDIPAQSLASALQQLANQSGRAMLYAEQSAAGKTSPALRGEFSVEEAVRQLINGSGLTYSIGADGTVTLKPASSGSDATTLGAVLVKGTSDPSDPYNKDYSVSNAVTGTKTDTPLFDTPISVQVLPKAVIDDQQAIGLENALKNVSGVAKGWGFGNDKDENLYIRGFANTNNIYRDGVLTPNTPISLANAERIEVLKGPSAMLYGRAQPGGLVNIVTKRPRTDAYYSLQQQFGSFDTYRTLLDATNKITADGALAYRLNYEHLDSATFRDNHPVTRDFVAPSLSWNITDHTRLDLDFMYQNVKDVADSGIPYSLQQSGAIPGKIPFHFSGNEPTDFADKEAYTGEIGRAHV